MDPFLSPPPANRPSQSQTRSRPPRKTPLHKGNTSRREKTEKETQRIFGSHKTQTTDEPRKQKTKFLARAVKEDRDPTAAKCTPRVQGSTSLRTVVMKVSGQRCCCRKRFQQLMGVRHNENDHSSSQFSVHKALSCLEGQSA